MANQKLEALRARMAQEGMDAYMVPTSDFHESEYVGEHFKARSYLSGFTGSAGVCVVLKDEAELWTDGRYFIQAENQLRGTGIKLMKIAEPGVPTVEQFLAEKLPEGGCLGYDGRVVNTRTAQNLEKALAGRHARFAIDKDLVGEIWTDRPALSAKPAFRLTDAQAGVTAKEKLALIRGDMAENGAGRAAAAHAGRNRLAAEPARRRHRLQSLSAGFRGGGKGTGAALCAEEGGQR